jgi:hypothetical protein
MFRNFFKTSCAIEADPVDMALEQLRLEPVLRQSDALTIERLFKRVFSSEDGQRALAYLRYITAQKSGGPDASEAQLRFYDGQRALIAQFNRYVNGRQ